MNAPEILTDAQLAELGRIKIGIWKIQDAMERLNALIDASGLPIRRAEGFTLSLQLNDISQIAFSDELARNMARDKAMERLAA